MNGIEKIPFEFLVKNSGNFAVPAKPYIVNNVPSLAVYESLCIPAYLQSKFTGASILIEEGNYTDKNLKQKHLDLGQFFGEKWKTKKKIHLAQCSLSDFFPKIANELRYFDLELSEYKSRLYLWMGNKGVSSPLHYDNAHNVNLQIDGLKRFTLFPPESSTFLYPEQDQETKHISQVDYRRPNLDLYPDFAKCQSVEHELQPGEMIIIPKNWWHFVKALDHSINVNYFWKTNSEVLIDFVKKSVDARETVNLPSDVFYNGKWL